MGRSSAEVRKTDAEMLKKHRIVLGACVDCGKRKADILAVRSPCERVLPSAKPFPSHSPASMHAIVPDAIMPRQSVPVSATASGTKRCPHCAEDIKAEAIVCRFCGHDLDRDDGAEGRMRHAFEIGKCIHCGMSEHWVSTYGTLCILDLSKPQKPARPKAHFGRTCPKCYSANITDHARGFGVGKALVGGALTGGVGLLAGFIGSSTIMSTCLACGHRWKPGR